MESLIVIEQLPVVREHFDRLKALWEQKAKDAEAMVCTEDTVQAVKAYRADMRKDYQEANAEFNAFLKAVMEPIDKVKAAFKECVTSPFDCADAAFKAKISNVESEIKRRCEDALRDYFAELCAAYHVGWLKYEQAGIKVDMASAKQKTPKKLREHLAAFVDHVSTVADRISRMDNAEEILVEYKKRLDFSEAVDAVRDRHRRIEAERQQMEQMAARKAAEEEAVRRAEALAPPTVMEEQISVTFIVTDTKERLIALREWMKANGYEYR